MNRMSSIALLTGQRGKVLGLFALVVAVTVCAFLAGWWAASPGANSDQAAAQAIEENAERNSLNTQQIREEIERLRTRAEVDRQALELLRLEIVAHKEQVMGLEDNLRFYRSLMTPLSGEGGISLRAPEIVPGPARDVFVYRLVIQQVAAKHAMVNGSLSAELEGDLQGELVSYPLQELHNGSGQPLPALKFRYFQAVEGEIILPQGFKPQRLSLTAQINKPRKLELQEQFSWQVQEHSSNVGK